MKDQDIKQASNFELNRIKIGKYDFQLEVGDRFKSNDSFFSYYPLKGGSNAHKLPYH